MKRLCFALLIAALIVHATFDIDYSGAAPTTLGLVRVSRDLHRRLGGAEPLQAVASPYALGLR